MAHRPTPPPSIANGKVPPRHQQVPARPRTDTSVSVPKRDGPVAKVQGAEKRAPARPSGPSLLEGSCYSVDPKVTARQCEDKMLKWAMLNSRPEPPPPPPAPPPRGRTPVQEEVGTVAAPITVPDSPEPGPGNRPTPAGPPPSEAVIDQQALARQRMGYINGLHQRYQTENRHGVRMLDGKVGCELQKAVASGASAEAVIETRPVADAISAVVSSSSAISQALVNKLIAKGNKVGTVGGRGGGSSSSSGDDEEEAGGEVVGTFKTANKLEGVDITKPLAATPVSTCVMSNVDRTLKTHQKRAVRFCIDRERASPDHPLSGGILNLEQGTGKTRIAFGLALHGEGKGPTLFICDVNLIGTAIEELRACCDRPDRLKIVTVHDKAIHHKDRIDAAMLARCHVVFTTRHIVLSAAKLSGKMQDDDDDDEDEEEADYRYDDDDDDGDCMVYDGAGRKGRARKRASGKARDIDDDCGYEENGGGTTEDDCDEGSEDRGWTDLLDAIVNMPEGGDGGQGRQVRERAPEGASASSLPSSQKQTASGKRKRKASAKPAVSVKARRGMLSSSRMAAATDPSARGGSRGRALAVVNKTGSRDQAYKALMEVKWRRVIMDEAHAIRNMTSSKLSAKAKVKTAAAVMLLSRQSSWILTGTLIHSGGGNLFAYLLFMQMKIPNYREWLRSITTSPAEIKRLCDVLDWYVLRETRENLALSDPSMRLPELKRYAFVHPFITKTETDTYREQMEETSRALIQVSRGVGKELDVLNKLMRSRQACVAMSIADPNAYPHPSSGIFSTKMLMLWKYLCLTVDDISEGFARSLPHHTSSSSSSEGGRPSTSSASDAVDPMEAKRATGGTKVIVFSDFLKCLEVVERMFIEMQKRARNGAPEHLVPRALQNFRWAFIRGGMSEKQLQEQRVAFQEDPRVRVLLATRGAASQGYGFSAGNVVIFMDPAYNGQTDEQALSRAYRLGQKRSVDVIHMMISGSCEEGVRDLAVRKNKVAHQIQNLGVISPDAFGKKRMKRMGLEDIRCLVKQEDNRRMNTDASAQDPVACSVEEDPYRTSLYTDGELAIMLGHIRVALTGNWTLTNLPANYRYKPLDLVFGNGGVGGGVTGGGGGGLVGQPSASTRYWRPILPAPPKPPPVAQTINSASPHDPFTPLIPSNRVADRGGSFGGWRELTTMKTTIPNSVPESARGSFGAFTLQDPSSSSARRRRQRNPGTTIEVFKL